MTVGYLITARLKSTRLTKKVVREIAGRPILAHMLDRLKLAKRVDEIVICTSTNPQDDPLEQLAAQEGVRCFRGHEEDVILRLHEATAHFGYDYVLNITADCPFADPRYADLIVEAYERTDADLIRAFGLPHGAFSYGLKPDALRRVVEIKNDDRTEVWGKYFTDTDLFSAYDLPIENEDHQWPELRMTLDYPADLQFFEAVFAALYRPGEVFSLDEILAFLREHPEVVEINRHCATAFEKRFRRQAGISLKPRYEISKALVIGAGSIGQRHIRNLRALGIGDIVALRSRQGHHQNLNPDLRVTEINAWHELAAVQPDIAVISNPTSLHLDAIRRVLREVRGVFVEKPLSHSWDSVPEILDEVGTYRRTSFVGYSLQFHPIAIAVLEALESERFGAPLAFQGQVGHWLPDWHPYEDWRAGYTARSDLGGGAALTLIHELRMAVSWFGPVERVIGECRASLSLEADVDVNTNLMLRHDSGATTQLHLDLLQKPYHREGVISCERGWIRYDFVSSTVTAQSHEDEAPSVLWSGQGYDSNEPYLSMMSRFFQYVREGRVRHEFDAWTAAADLSVVLAAFESARSLRWEAPSKP